jgi:DNA-binding protein HU-beta
MNRDDVIKSVAEQMQTTQADASEAVKAIFDSITESLKQGDPVKLVGFGSFKAVPRTARQGRNPRTGEPLSIPAATIVSFKAGKELRDAVNG